MRYLIISDIHANWEALEGVLADADGLYESVCCLGDTVGYGADPNRCAEWVRDNCERVIRGNHDKVCCGIEEPIYFNPAARSAAEWTREALSEGNLEYLRNLPQGALDLGPFLMAHGSVRDEDEYILDFDTAAAQLPHMPRRAAFFGHTHLQGGFLLRSASPDQPTAVSERPGQLQLRDGDSMLINPGSVGQPRDMVWKAAYAIYETETRVLEYRRCEYDLALAQKKIRNAGLPEMLADRLALGR